MKEGFFLILFLIIFISICDTISQLILESAINSVGFGIGGRISKILRFFLRLAMIPWVWLALFFSILSLCLWLFVLSRAELNFAFSIDSMHYIFIALGSSVILKEKVGFQRWLGTILIVAGIILVSIS